MYRTLFKNMHKNKRNERTPYNREMKRVDESDVWQVYLLIRFRATLWNHFTYSAKSSEYKNSAVKSTDLEKATRTNLSWSWFHISTLEKSDRDLVKWHGIIFYGSQYDGDNHVLM